MIHMQMTDDEIRGSYRRAEDKTEQIKVLAELNAVKTPVMRQYLIDLGEITPRKSPVKVDEERAQELLAQGLTNEKIAEALGVGVNAVAVWKRRFREEELERQRAQKAFTLRDLAAVFTSIAQVYPTAELHLSGTPVRSVEITVHYDASGTAYAELRTEG